MEVFSTSLAIGRGIYQSLVDSPNKWPVIHTFLCLSEVILFEHCGQFIESDHKTSSKNTLVKLRISLGLTCEHSSMMTRSKWPSSKYFSGPVMAAVVSVARTTWAFFSTRAVAVSSWRHRSFRSSLTSCRNDCCLPRSFVLRSSTWKKKTVRSKGNATWLSTIFQPWVPLIIEWLCGYWREMASIFP